MKTIVSQIRRIFTDDGRNDRTEEITQKENNLREALKKLHKASDFMIAASQEFRDVLNSNGVRH